MAGFIRLTCSFVLLALVGLSGAAVTAAPADDPPVPPRSVAGAQFAERMIVCGPRRGCRALREGCRLVLAPHPRNNRVRCTPVGAA
jgi:hypothetical protein